VTVSNSVVLIVVPLPKRVVGTTWDSVTLIVVSFPEAKAVEVTPVVLFTVIVSGATVVV